MLKFKEFLLKIEQNTVGKHNDYATGAVLGSISTGTEMPDFGGRVPHLTSQDLIMTGVPTKEAKGKITQVILNRDPVFIGLSDGTQLNIPIDALRKRVLGWPADDKPEGKRMHVVFQRRADDKSDNYSQIAWATID